MNWNQIRIVLSLLLLVSFGGVAYGQVVIVQPPGLAPGAQYRLIFITSSTRTAFSSNIDDYNAFVQGAASSSAPLAALGTTWRAIGSTSVVDARDNTGTQQVGVNDYPIYRLDGGLVAPNNSGLWDGALDRTININEHGVILPFGPGCCVFTGTNTNGTRTPNHLGSGLGQITAGAYGFQFGSWINDQLQFPDTSLRMYALSAPITVVPEPSSCTVAGMAIAAWASRRRRSKKSQGSPPALPNA